MPSLQRNQFNVKLYQYLLSFANRLAALPTKMVPAPFRIIQIGSAYWQSRALYVAAELGVADALGDQEMSSEEIADSLGLHADNLHRLLRMLTSIGVFEMGKTGCFRNNKFSDCLRSHAFQSVRDMVLLHNSPEMSKAWYEQLGSAIRNGEVPFSLSQGEELFDYLDHHPEFDALFTGAMESVEAITGSDYLSDFDWSRFDRLVDVGGSNGSKTIAILKHNPRMHAVVFDRPQVIRNAAADWAGKIDEEVLARLEYSGGDMFEAIPAAQSDRDVYLFVAIFHGMDDVQAEKILTNLRLACGSFKPAIAIIDCIIDEPHVDPTIASFDMQMMIGTRGLERTEQQWHALFSRAGFKLQEVVRLRTFASLLVVSAD